MLQSLADGDLALLAPDFTRIKLERELVLSAANAPIEHIYFPEGGIASVVSSSPGVAETEVGLFGREGMSGMSVLLGVDQATTKTFMQVDGSTALRIPTVRLRAAMAKSPSLTTQLMRSVQTMITQLTQGIVSNAHHPLEARLARWLLMCHDRVDGDELMLTHEFMAMMIGAQRTGVTVTLHILEGGGSITSKRGRVIIRDRARLEDLAGAAYGRAEAEYRKLIAPFGRGTAHESD